MKSLRRGLAILGGLMLMFLTGCPVSGLWGRGVLDDLQILERPREEETHRNLASHTELENQTIKAGYDAPETHSRLAGHADLETHRNIAGHEWLEDRIIEAGHWRVEN